MPEEDSRRMRASSEVREAEAKCTRHAQDAALETVHPGAAEAPARLAQILGRKHRCPFRASGAS